MDNLEILYAFLIFTLFFAGISTFFGLWSRHLSDLRTLKLGRLTALFLFGILITLNGFIALALILRVSDIAVSFSEIGVIALIVEVIVLLIFPILFGIFLPIAIIVLSVRMWRRESKSVANLLLPIIMLIFLIVDAIYLRIGHLPDSWLWLRVLSWAYPILAVYLSWQFLIFFLSSWVYGRRMRKQSAAYHVVLGAGLIGGDKVGKLLANRIHAAVNAANEQTILIFSGGQGADEKISEAFAMQRYAVEELHFPIERTILEEKSRTTYENLMFSAQKINEQNTETAKFLFFSSDYHVFRAALFARQLNLDAQGGRGGKTAMYYRVPAFLREFIAIMNNERKKHMIWVGLIVAILVIVALIVGIMYQLNK
ncbi:ElyC/SanA/YdcF family protein [Lactococcus nasutitermitis]|uniref:ElyC/SanA/YdcF family protein n=1 Tax=Lactococcus nasutitermitis TaxID=1652957 RepID=A0ABV9JBC1_9LACT|nr:YdcF family protein [Lactococcus nasutitermitis]